MPTRRDILGLFATAVMAPPRLLSMSATRRPFALRPGATIGIVAPAGPVQVRQLKGGIEFFRSLGFRVELGRFLNTGKGYLAASDRERATELMEFLLRQDIDALVCARGGYGTLRILPLLDFDALNDCTKPVVGYSDITALLITLYQRCNLITFHGPMASSEFDSTTAGSFIATLVQLENETMPPSQLQLSYTDDSFDTIVEGVAEGRLLGGNLSILCSLLGTPYEPDTRDCILFIEDVGEESYKIDRMLTQLELAGKLDGVRGMLVGSFTKASPSVREESSTAGEITPAIRDVIAERCNQHGIPALANVPFGHIKSKFTLPIGARARLDSVYKTLTILEPTVEWHR